MHQTSLTSAISYISTEVSAGEALGSVLLQYKQNAVLCSSCAKERSSVLRKALWGAHRSAAHLTSLNGQSVIGSSGAHAPPLHPDLTLEEGDCRWLS